MKTLIIIIVIAAVGYSAYKWFSRKPQPSKGGNGGTDTPGDDRRTEQKQPKS